MEKEIKYREIHQGEKTKVCSMVIDCFNEFVSPEYNNDGIMEFKKYVEPNRMKETDAGEFCSCLKKTK